MDRDPPIDVILALEGEPIKFRVKCGPDEDPPVEGPRFFANGEPQTTLGLGNIDLSIGSNTSGEQNNRSTVALSPEMQYSSTVRFDEPGNQVVEARWSDREGVSLSPTESPSAGQDIESLRWGVHVIADSTTIDHLKERLEDIVVAGSAVYGGAKIIHWLRQQSASGDDEANGDELENSERDFFQDRITNFE